MQSVKPVPILTFNTPEQLQAISDEIQPCFNLKLGDILVADHIITEVQLKHALSVQKIKPNKRIGALLTHLGYASETEIYRTLMKKFGLPMVNPNDFPITDSVKHLIPLELTELYQVLPLVVLKNRLFLAMTDPLDWGAIQLVSEKVSLSIEPVLTTSENLKKAILVRHKNSLLKPTNIVPLNSKFILPEDGQGLNVLTLRSAFQKYLLDWIRTQNHDVLPKLKSLIQRLKKVSTVKAVMELWWAAEILLNLLIHHGIEANVEIKLLLGQVDRQIKRLADVGELAFADSPIWFLRDDLLRYVTLSDQQNKALKPLLHEVIAYFQLAAPSAARLKAKKIAEKATVLTPQQVAASIQTAYNAPKPPPVPENNDKLKIGSIIRDRFIITGVLGQGGMGKVYKAIDKRRQEAKDTNCLVAIKVLNDAFKNNPSAFISLQREARKTQMLNHPNIVNVNDFDRDGDTIYLVMEYLQGMSLAELIHSRFPQGMPMRHVLRILKDLVLALDFAHANHIIHCDFKPGNAFMTKNRKIKVIDFGIARVSSTAQKGRRPSFLDIGIASGCTPAYATYELLYNKEPSPTDDVYALAVTTYKMLTGEHPFHGHSTVEAARLGLSAKRIEVLSRRQWKGLLRGLAFEKNQRTQTAYQFLLDVAPQGFIFPAKAALSPVCRLLKRTIQKYLLPQEADVSELKL